ncbi:MAG: peroxiredoxin [Candidatus Obscuribacterales bacterium]|nr:peroxiredoxin [Candidatus Obscuribacterales bacterium]
MTSPYEADIEFIPGDTAPPFSLQAYPSGTVSLSDFLGKKNLILAFYPMDDTPGCTKEMCTFSEQRDEFAQYNCVVLGISCDDLESHGIFALKHGLRHQLLADTTCAVGRAYGAVKGDRFVSERVLFLIDKNGLIRDVKHGMPDFEELLMLAKGLHELQTEEA